jgi:hypothetical protein
MACWGRINQDSELYSIFGDSEVPIVSIVPFIPREDGCPPCYMVKGNALSPELLEKTASLILQQWQEECTSLEVAKQYIINNGLPLLTTHFSSVFSDDYFHMPMGAALNALIHFIYNKTKN